MKKDKNNISASSEVKQANKKSAYARKRIFRHGGYAIALTAIFIAVVIMLNIGATMLAKTFSMKVDLTANRDLSISSDNKDYIKNVKRDVHIVVCCEKEFYKDTLFQYLEGQGGFVSQGGMQQYFVQNAYLLEEYDKLSKHITVEYADPQEPEFNKYVKRYPNASLSTGNILVESSFEVDGEKVDRYRVINLIDTLSIDEDTSASMNAQVVNGNKIETALTSAIYTVTADRTLNVALVTANGGAPITNLQSYMEMNNYQFTEVKSLLTDNIPADSDLVIISRPTHDYSAEELAKLDEYLKLKKEKKSVLMYIASIEQGNLPNLNEFLDEWGFTVVPENVVMETASENAYIIPSNIFMGEITNNGYSDNVSRDDYRYIASGNVPVIAKKPKDRQLNTILQISSSAIAVPLDADDSFKESDAKHKGPFIGVGISSKSDYDSDNNFMTSSVIMLSSIDLINTSDNNYAEVGNLELLSVVIDEAIGNDSVDIRFDTRVFETSDFLPPSEASVNTMRIIFIYALPLAVLVCGVVIYIRRRRS